MDLEEEEETEEKVDIKKEAIEERPWQGKQIKMEMGCDGDSSPSVRRPRRSARSTIPDDFEVTSLVSR